VADVWPKPVDPFEILQEDCEIEADAETVSSRRRIYYEDSSVYAQGYWRPKMVFDETTDGSERLASQLIATRSGGSMELDAAFWRGYSPEDDNDIRRRDRLWNYLLPPTEPTANANRVSRHEPNLPVEDRTSKEVAQND
jgi:hypothetical protein